MKNLILSFFCFSLLSFSCAKKRGSQGDPVSVTPVIPVINTSLLQNHLGINAFEWDFSDNDNTVISDGKMNVIKSFGGFRHYLDWDKLESEEGKYTFNPVHSGGWNYDMIYAKCKAEGIEVLSCIKNCPTWLVNTYPVDQRDAENVPAPYGLDRSDPASYIKEARVAFQFAARYGHTTNVDPTLLSVNTAQRWNGDPINQVKIGLGYINYIECDNERDKWWKGAKAQQSPEEYAANMSAFYDGHLGKLGKNVGVKTADPTMKVVMGGLATPDVNFVIKMIEWCRKNRGLKADGSVNLCFDVINYHNYSNNSTVSQGSTAGRAPELSPAAKTADDFIAMAKEKANGTEVWLTEAGYDINTSSPQRAIKIGNKSVLITQADWMLRTALLNVRHGLKRSFFYMLDDVDVNSTIQYSSSGFAVGQVRRPVADYFLQTKKLMGNFQYQETISTDPTVDIYALNTRRIYVLSIPDQVGRTKLYELDLGASKAATAYTLAPGGSEMIAEKLVTVNGKLKITVTETPIFIEKE